VNQTAALIVLICNDNDQRATVT